MGKDIDRIPGEIGCLDTPNLPATLISTTGNHCEVWQTGRGVGNVVIKKHHRRCSFAEVSAYRREYRQLKTALEEMIPCTRYVVTKVEGMLNVVALAESVTRWFNLANPLNEEETIPLMRQLPIARSQLRRFLGAAHHWYSDGARKVIDLYGLDNLILDHNREVRYVDSFGVFFYADMLDYVNDDDNDLGHRIGVSRKRLQYLRHILHAAERKGVG